jgi:hypothetical protein
MKSFVIRILILGVFIFLTLNRHSRTGVFTYQSEIWADKAGYYVYLPSLFIYGFDASSFPDSIDVKTGDGFHLVDGKGSMCYCFYLFRLLFFCLSFFTGNMRTVRLYTILMETNHL